MLASETVGVFGSGTADYPDAAAAVGDALADLGVNLLTGGGGGVMTAVSRAFTRHESRRGICIGIIPCASESDRATPKAGYPNAFVELPIYTHLPYSGHQGTHELSRNHINVLSCAAIVALPGGEGTAAEVSLAIKYGRPVIAFSPDASLVSNVPEAVPRSSRIEEVMAFLRAHLRL
jgi:uncharacterized protein (TIGR00725 family)